MRRRVDATSRFAPPFAPIRHFREAVEAGDKGKAGELLVPTSRELDKAATKWRHPRQPGLPTRSRPWRWPSTSLI